MTGANPILEGLEREWNDTRRWTAAHFHPHHHAADAAPQTPAPQPVNLAPANGAVPRRRTMSLATLEDDVKADLTDGMAWLEGLVQRVKTAAPGIIATSEAVAGSTVGQLAEIFLGKVLPPDVEAELLGIVKRYVTTFGQPAQAVAPTGQQPVQPQVPAGQ